MTNYDRNSGNPLPFLDEINEFFYEGMDRETSICLFGSAATGNWVSGRSDLDLVILAPKEKTAILSKKIRDWTFSSNSKYPILDGYVFTMSNGSFEIIKLEEFLRVTFPSSTKIDLVDQWLIKNRSKHLFGAESIGFLLSDVSKSELRVYALDNFKHMFISNPNGILPEPTVVLSKLIWIVSWSARMIMLTRGIVCESKRDALLWLANEFPEKKDLIHLMLDNYLKLDDVALSITSEQSMNLREFCFRIMLQEGKSALAENNR